MDGGYAGECVLPDSNISISLNGESKTAEQMNEGDAILYYDFATDTVKQGMVNKVYVHKKATDFVRYSFSDDTYVEVTDYHPIYTDTGWKSLTQRNGYDKPEVDDKVKTKAGWKTLTKIEIWTDEIDCYDFSVLSEEGQIIDNYYANDTLVQASIN